MGDMTIEEYIEATREFLRGAIGELTVQETEVEDDLPLLDAVCQLAAAVGALTDAVETLTEQSLLLEVEVADEEELDDDDEGPKGMVH